MSATSSTPPWHALGVEEVLARLGSTRGGLESDEVVRRLATHGPNALSVRSGISPWRILAHQVGSIVVGLLVVAAGIALLLGDLLEALAIGAVLLINVLVGFWTEWRARVAVDALRRLQVQEATVLRAGVGVRIDAAQVVPGDILLLSEGDAIAADGRLIEAAELTIDEAPLTGESMPVSKSLEPADAETSLGDRRCMVHKGTLVAGGAGRAVVTATGRRTEIGRIGDLVGSLEQAPTPIERRLALLGRRLVWITIGIAGVVILAGLLRGLDAWLVIETGLALAIAAVPEGLPVVATVTLAVGMWRMAGRNALVRRPPAVEALGSATVICTDKTGTLTTGRMTATTLVVAGERVEVSGAGLDLHGVLEVEEGAITPDLSRGIGSMVRTGVLANAASLAPAPEASPEEARAAGDPTDVALLVLGAKCGIHREALLEVEPVVGLLPFSSHRMLMASFHGIRPDGGVEARGPGFVTGVAVCAKGATDPILAACDDWVSGEGSVPLDDGARGAISDWSRRLGEEGLRVIALARGSCGAEHVGKESALRGLTFEGLVGLMDPPTPQVAETIAGFRAAGIRTVMITGDHPATARSVALRVGLMEEGDLVVSGRELAEMGDAELAERVGSVAVFGRVSPADKLRIVEALQAGGGVVGMLGDGVNDGPALKRADIGVAMGGRGTDVAKGVADLVLADDRLETVGVAVEEGRVIFDNIRKFIFYLFSCNVSEVGIVFFASLVALPLPLLPLQLLWLNVVTDVFPALALSVEPREPDVMRRAPRPQQAAILSRGFLIHLTVYATLITAAALGVFVWGLREGEGVEHAVTLAFMTLAFAQLLHVFNARSFGPLTMGRQLFRNRWLWAALVLSAGLQLLAIYNPVLSRVLNTRPLGVTDWLVVLSAALTPLVLGQLWKRFVATRRSGG